jgi:hypothetical protein
MRENLALKIAAVRRSPLFRGVCLLMMLVGFGLLIRALLGIVGGRPPGDMAAAVSAGMPGWLEYAFSLGVSLPVPFHVMAVGLFLQRDRLSPVWRRGAWWGVVISGLWLGLALLVKWVFLP